MRVLRRMMPFKAGAAALALARTADYVSSVASAVHDPLTLGAAATVLDVGATIPARFIRVRQEAQATAYLTSALRAGILS